MADLQLTLLSVFAFSISPYNSPVRWEIFIYRWGNWGSVASPMQEQGRPLKSVLLDCLANAGVQAPSVHTGKGCWKVRIQLDGISLLLSYTLRVARSWAGTLSLIPSVSKCHELKSLNFSFILLMDYYLLFTKMQLLFCFFGLNAHLHPASSGELVFSSNLIFLRVCHGPRRCSRFLLSNPM